MKQLLETPYGPINYELRPSLKARHLRIEVKPDGEVLAVLPRFVSRRQLEEFVAQKAAWIIKARKTIEKKGPARLEKVAPALARKHYLRYKDKARLFVKERLEYLNRPYGFSYNKISIRNQKTRWGSCSRAGNLNFNYKIIFLDPSLADYLLVHELCHLKELNHSSRFWALVAKAIPDYRRWRRELHEQDFADFVSNN